MKPAAAPAIVNLVASHPTRVRGLKQAVDYPGQHVRPKSHPTRVRGLKLGENDDLYLLFFVAPHAGAWIETIDFIRI